MEGQRVVWCITHIILCFQLIAASALLITHYVPDDDASSAAGMMAPPREVKLIGGENTTAGEFPFVTSLQMNPPFGDSYHFCTGSIINASHVLTSATCVADRLPSQVLVLAGAHNLSDLDSVQTRTLQAVTLHPSYNPDKLLYDLAILSLNESLQFNPLVQPMPTPSPDTNFTGDCTLLGFSPQGPSLLQKTGMTLVSQNTCSNIYSHLIDISSESMFCARSGDGKGACTGDLGAPLLCQAPTGSFVAGLVTWGMVPCGDSGYPAIFTNTTLENERF